MKGAAARTGSVGALVAYALAAASACTLHHSKTVVPGTHGGDIDLDATFISEDDAGLALLSLFVISEPDHYAVLYERARRKCPHLSHVQIDFYTDVWLFVSFPIVRLTALCSPTEDAPPPDATPPPPPDTTPPPPVEPPPPEPPAGAEPEAPSAR